MVDRYSIPWCYGVCGCTGSPILKQLKVLLGSDEALEEEGQRVDPRSKVLSRQVGPSPTERSGATTNLPSPSRSLFPLSRSLSLSVSLFSPLSFSLNSSNFSGQGWGFALFFQWVGERCRYLYGLFIYFLIFFI